MKKLMVPRKGVKVRDPVTGLHLPEEGAEREVNSYYNRRLADGDLEIRAIPKKANPKKSTKDEPRGES